MNGDTATALIADLSARLLAATSATEALRSWCDAHGLGEGEIVARRHAESPASRPDDEVVARLGAEADAPVRHRRVDLARGGLVLAEADNWFLPQRLAPAMREALARTSLPFGRVVQPLRPVRRTFLVRSADLAPDDAAPRRGPDPRAGGLPPGIILEHRAVVLREDGAPIAVVHERYRSALIEPGGRGAPSRRA